MHERTTSYIKHLAVSRLSGVIARIKDTCNLTENCFEMPNVSYTQTLEVIVERLRSNIESLKKIKNLTVISQIIITFAKNKKHNETIKKCTIPSILDVYVHL